MSLAAFLHKNACSACSCMILHAHMCSAMPGHSAAAAPVSQSLTVCHCRKPVYTSRPMIANVMRIKAGQEDTRDNTHIYPYAEYVHEVLTVKLAAIVPLQPHLPSLIPAACQAVIAAKMSYLIPPYPEMMHRMPLAYLRRHLHPLSAPQATLHFLSSRCAPLQPYPGRPDPAMTQG